MFCWAARGLMFCCLLPGQKVEASRTAPKPRGNRTAFKTCKEPSTLTLCAVQLGPWTRYQSGAWRPQWLAQKAHLLSLASSRSRRWPRSGAERRLGRQAFRRAEQHAPAKGRVITYGNFLDSLNVDCVSPKSRGKLVVDCIRRGTAAGRGRQTANQAASSTTQAGRFAAEE